MGREQVGKEYGGIRVERASTFEDQLILRVIESSWVFETFYESLRVLDTV